MYFRLGLFHLEMGYNLDPKVVELGMERVQVVGRHTVRQKVIDIVVGELALLAGQVEQGLECFSQIRQLGPRASTGVAAIPGADDLALGSGTSFGALIEGCLRLQFITASGLGPKNETAARPVSVARGCSLLAAAAILGSVIRFGLLH